MARKNTKTMHPGTASRKTVSSKATSKRPASGKIAGNPKKVSKTAKLSGNAKSVKPPKKKTGKNIQITKPKETTRKTADARTGKKLTPREKRFLDIRKKLLEQKSALLSEAEVALNSLPGQTIFPDLGDQASAEIDRNFMLRLRGREQRLLKKIDEAIEKIENGSFGICDVCGQEIDIKRLEARPVTTMCIYCKTEQEEEEKIRGI